MLSTTLRESIQTLEKKLGFKSDIKWTTTILITLYHALAVYWCYSYTFPVKWQTIVLTAVLTVLGNLGVTVGAHRLWTHRSFKAKLIPQIILLVCFSSTGQNSVFDWVRDHRVHHKYSDTDADPHNINRGLFFSHIGWLMMKKNDHVKTAGNKIYMSDITNNPLLRFYHRNFIFFKLMFCFLIPLYVNIYLLNENWRIAMTWQWFIRYMTLLHGEFTVNSLAHSYGYKPYNKNIKPSENRFVATITFGEGWHNYHHAFPFDYKAAEHFDIFNLATRCIQGFHKIGWAYDLLEATPKTITSTMRRLGDEFPIGNEIPHEEEISSL